MTASPQLADRFALVGETLAGRFLIERLVAEGGFGVVYRAEQLALARPVAIKVFKTEGLGDPAFHRAFDAEARTIARLKHPGIVEVYDFGTTEVRPGVIVSWMALEWLEGQTLAEWLTPRAAAGGLDRTAAMALMAPVIEAVAFAHRERVVHCDLKPSNIFLCQAREQSQPKVLDFGIATMLAEDDATRPAAAGGRPRTTGGFRAFSPDYAAPEQVSYGKIGPATDVHALGLVLTEILTGKRPYSDGLPDEPLEAVISERRPTPGSKGIDVGAWEPVLHKALARRPAERHPNADALLAALRRALAPGAPVQTQHAAPVPAHLPGPGRRRTALGAGVAALALGALATLFFVFRAPQPAPPAGRIMLAVLPFENLTGDAQQEFLCDGLTDGLISQLGRLMPNRLRVVARTSVSRFKGTRKPAKEIGGELGVAYLLAASVRRTGERVQVDTHLISTDDETMVWSDSFDQALVDVLALHAEMARAVANGIRLERGAKEPVSGRNRAVIPAAYQAFLRAQYAPFKDRPAAVADRLRLAAYEEAIKLDPTYAPAYAGMAGLLSSQNKIESRTDDVAPRAKGAAQRALELDEQLPQAHAALGHVLLNQEWNWATAERHFRRALELDPNDPRALDHFGQYCLTVGRYADAVTARARAAELDPLSLDAQWRLGSAYYYARDYDAALKQLGKTLAIDANITPARAHLALVYSMKGMSDEAVVHAERLGDGTVKGAGGLGPVAVRGYVLARAGRTADAEAILAQLTDATRTRYVLPVHFARVHVGLGQTDQAFTWLARALEDHNTNLVFLGADPLWDPLRSDPRFGELLRKVGIPPSAFAAP